MGIKIVDHTLPTRSDLLLVVGDTLIEQGTHAPYLVITQKLDEIDTFGVVALQGNVGEVMYRSPSLKFLSDVMKRKGVTKVDFTLTLEPEQPITKTSIDLDPPYDDLDSDQKSIFDDFLERYEVPAPSSEEVHEFIKQEHLASNPPITGAWRIPVLT